MQRHKSHHGRSSDQAYIWDLGTSEIYRFSQRAFRRSRRFRAPASRFPWFSPIQ